MTPAPTFDRTAAEEYLDATLGSDVPGFASLAFGYDGAWIDGRWKYRKDKWIERSYAYPGTRQQLLDDVERELLAGNSVDVYLAPYVRTEDRRTSPAAARPLLHADRDGDDPVQPAELATLSAFAVASGTPGHEHVYIPLAASVGPEEHEVLCRALKARLSASGAKVDAKVKDNDVLRLPGTLNFKHTPPEPVVWLCRPNGTRPTPEHLARVLGVGTAASALSATRGAVAPASVDDLPQRVRDALAEVTDDRSVDTFRVTAACVDAGLSLPETRAAIATRADLDGRLGERQDDDVWNSWQKLTSDRSAWSIATISVGGDPSRGEWEASAPLRLGGRPIPKVPAFPLDALPVDLARHVEAVATASLTPLDFAAIACLGAVSAACSGHVNVRITRTYTQPVNLYLVPVAGPGEGKTPAFAPFEAVLFDWQTQLREHGRSARAEAMAKHEAAQERVEAARKALQKAVAPTGKAKLQVVRDEARPETIADEDGAEQTLAKAILAAEDAPKPITPTTVITGNATPEALAKLMADNDGRMAIMATEGRIVDIVSGLYGTKVDLTPVLMAYDGSPIDGHRIGRDVPDVPNPSLVMAVAVQPVVMIDAMADRQLRDRGMIPRLLVACPLPMIGKRDRALTEVPERVEAPAFSRLRGLLEQAAAHTNTTLTLSRTAYANFEAYRRALDRRSGPGGDLPRLAAWAAKHAARAVRLAALLHLAGDPAGGWATPISGEEFDSAQRIADYFVEHQVAMLAAAEEDESTGDDSAPAYLLRFLQRRDPKPEGWTVRDLSRAVSKSRFPGGESDLRGALEVLSDYGWVWMWTPDKTTTGGRPPSLRVVTHRAMHTRTPDPVSRPADFADVADNGGSPAETLSASHADIAPSLADIAPDWPSNVGNVGKANDLADVQNPRSEGTVGKVGKVGSTQTVISADTAEALSMSTHSDDLAAVLGHQCPECLYTRGTHHRDCHERTLA